MAASARASTRRKPFEHPWRVAIVAIALIAVLNLGIVLLATSDTSTPGASSFPNAVEAVSPEPGEITGLVDDVTIDLRDDLTGDMTINDRLIPEDQLDRVPELGVITFRPGANKEFTKLLAGENTVVVHFWARDKGIDRPRRYGTYSWSFRATA